MLSINIEMVCIVCNYIHLGGFFKCHFSKCNKFYNAITKYICFFNSFLLNIMVFFFLSPIVQHLYMYWICSLLSQKSSEPSWSFIHDMRQLFWFQGSLNLLNVIFCYWNSILAVFEESIYYIHISPFLLQFKMANCLFYFIFIKITLYVIWESEIFKKVSK